MPYFQQAIEMKIQVQPIIGTEFKTRKDKDLQIIDPLIKQNELYPSYRYNAGEFYPLETFTMECNDYTGHTVW